MSNINSFRPLNGIKILDLTRLLPGPFATQYLGDLGAEILRVESPIPDLARYSPPFIHEYGSFDLSTNRNKKSITLNLKNEKAKLIFYQLVKEFDVIIEQFRPGIASKLEIDFESIKIIKPDIIYCSLSGYGQNGPYKDKPGHDINYLSEAGFFNDQIVNNEKIPYKLPQVPIADLAGSFSAVIAILSAIIQKQRSGKGQYLDVSMFDSITSWLNGCLPALGSINGILDSYQSCNYMLNGKKPFYRIYNTSDKPISVGALEPHFWEEFCNVLEIPEYIHEQFNENLHIEMEQKIESILIKEQCSYWLSKLRKICVAPVNTISEIHQNVQLQERNMFNKMILTNGLQIDCINNPLDFKSFGQQNTLRPPLPGEHTFEILENMGYSKQEIQELKNINAIQ